MHEHASLNRAYRAVFNDALGAVVAVPETAPARGTCTTRAVAADAFPPRRLAVAVALALAGPVAWALDPATLPQGGQVAAGQAQIASQGATLTVDQASQRAIVNWQSFDVGSGAAVRFAQPSATAVILNRVQSGPASQILGRMDATGQVYVVNPAGILFGKSAQVNVGGLTASTLQIADEDFLAGRDRFTFAGREGSVVNEGVLRVAPGGRIVLLGARVENRGEIVAPQGEVALAAGRQATLAIGANGHLQVAVDEAQVDALVANGGLVAADAGQVILTAKGAGALASSVVSNAGTVQARTVEGRAGRILLLADMEHGTVQAGGTLDASAPNGGDGGFVETSAARVQIAPDLHVTTAATQGRTGKWLIDPQDYTIAASGGDITGAQLSSMLGGTDVEIQSGTGGTAGNGDIHVNDAVSWNANTLTLTAARDIHIHAVMTASGTSALALNPHTANGADAAVSAGTVKVGLNDAGFIGRVDFPGRSGTGFLTINGVGYTVLDALGDPGSTTGTDLQGMNGALGGRYALGSDIDASATSGWNAGLGFAPIGGTGSFTGTLEGLGHAITGLTIDRRNENNVGLFSTIGGTGTVRNVALTGGSVRADGVNFSIEYRTGALAGTSSGTIVNVHGATDVWGLYNAGGLVGLVGGGSITGSQASGHVRGYNRTGGLAGTNQGTITGSHATGTVDDSGPGWSGGGDAIGGLVGFNDGTVTLSYANASVSGLGAVGGLVGDNNRTISLSHAGGSVIGEANAGGLAGFNYNSGRITDSYATATVTGADLGTLGCCGVSNTGGLVGYNLGGQISNSYAGGSVTGVNSAGGLVGYANNGSIMRSYATGSVTGEYAVGGLVGESSAAITDSYATGTVAGQDTVGGLVGIVEGRSINRSYANNTVTGTSNVGGLVGDRASGTVGNSFWNTGNGLSASDGGTGLTAAQMTQASSFTGWSVATTGGTTSTWRIYEGDTAPLLRNFLTPLMVTPAYDGTGAPLADAADYVVPAGTDTSRIFGASQLLLSSSGTAGNYLASLPGLYSSQTGYDILAVTRTIATPGSAAGDVRLDNPVTWTNGTVNITAANDVDLNNQTLNSTNGALTFNAGNRIMNAGNVAVNLFDLQGGTWDQVAATLPSFSATDFRISGGTFIRALGGDGTAAAPYRLADIHGVQGAASDGMADKAYVLAGDIDATGTATWNAGAGFAPIRLDADGSFDGQGHTIQGLHIARPAEYGVGLFSDNAGTVANLGLVGGEVEGLNQVGAVAGWSGGLLANVYSTATVTGANWVGGLVGSNAGEIQDSHATGKVDGDGIVVGGLAGSNFGAIARSHATGKVTGTDSYVGGLVGENAGTIDDSYATGDAEAQAWAAGGLVGLQSSGSITRSYATGRATATLARAGGLVGQSFGAISDSYATGGASGGDDAGGLVGVAGDGSSVANSYASGPVSGENWVGGLVGSLATGSSVTNSYASGAVSGALGVGGLAGYADDGSSVTNSYANGAVTGTSSVGGLVGARRSAAATVTGSYWDVTTTGRATSAGGTGVNNAAMRQQATFAGWDISADGAASNVWHIYEGHTAPLLRSFLTPLTVTANDATKTYDGQAYDGSMDVSYSLSPEPGMLLGTPSYTSGVNAGTYAIAVGGLYSHQQGYVIAFVDGTLRVDPKALTLTGLTANDKVYDQSAVAGFSGGALTGLVGTETLGFSASGNFDNPNAGNGRPVTVTSVDLSDGTGLAANYTVTLPTGLSADINPATLTLTGLAANNKVYDQSAAASFSGGALNGLLPGETLGFAASGNFDTPNAGTGKPVTVTAINLADGTGLAANYTVTRPTGLGANIDPAQLTLTGLTANNKVYDQSAAATFSGGTLTGLVGGETLSFSTSGNFNNPNAGTGKPVTVTAIDLADGTGLASNYTVLLPTGLSATIDPAQLTLSGLSANNKAYDQSAAASFSGGTLIGLVGGETLGFSASGNFDNPNAGTGKAVTVTAVDLADGTGLATNYTVFLPTGLSADIDPRTLNVTARGVDKVYDRTTAATVTVSDDRLAGDQLTLAATGASFRDANAGLGKTVDVGSITLSGRDAGNYTLSVNATTTANIVPAALLVAVQDEARVADGQPFSGPGTLRYFGLLPGDDASVLFGLPTWAGTAIGATLPGSYSLSVAGLSAANYDIRYADGVLTLVPGQNPLTSGEAQRRARQDVEAPPALPVPTQVRLTLAPDFLRVD